MCLHLFLGTCAEHNTREIAKMARRKQKDRTYFRIRTFLNADRAMPGILLAKVTQTEYISDHEGPSCFTDTDMTIGDCGRQISLGFDVDTEQEYRRAVQKINRLAKAVEGMRQALFDAHERVLELRKEQKIRQKKQQKRKKQEKREKEDQPRPESGE